jgi:uncharacterized protein YjiK
MLAKIIFISFFLTAQTCGNQSSTTKNASTNTVKDTLPYDLSNPSSSFKLDASLKEISGLTATTKQGQLACLQDESGQLVYLDAQTGKATPSVIFQNTGDFEGIEFVHDTMWATTSKGKLVKVWNMDKTPFDSQVFKIDNLKTANIEGLGYDKLNNRLLLSAKGDKKDDSQLRTVWAFDLEKQASSQTNRDASTVKKAFDIQLTDFQTFLKEKSEKQYAKLIKDYIENPAATGFEFGPSGIAIHPLSGHIYIVSSVNRTLVVLSAEGKILEMAKLDKILFPQPEGLCFDAEGTLYISNEAKDNPNASLLVFKMIK